MGHLRDVRVLAEETLEVTSHGGDGIGACTGQKMKEGFLFDRIDMAGNDLTIYETEKSAPAVFPDPTDPF
jgi:hypothetical protein